MLTLTFGKRRLKISVRTYVKEEGGTNPPFVKWLRAREDSTRC